MKFTHFFVASVLSLGSFCHALHDMGYMCIGLDHLNKTVLWVGAGCGICYWNASIAYLMFEVEGIVDI